MQQRIQQPRQDGTCLPSTIARLECRSGTITGHTAGRAPGFVQGNLCILSRQDAMDFATFCQRNPKPCPVVGMSAAGNPAIPDLGDLDIRTDLPRYRVFRNGECIDEPTDIRKYWSDDLVAFVLGCSFSFEAPLLDAGIQLDHISQDTVVPMYRTNIDCIPAGKFHGRMVVSMRMMTAQDAIRAIQITSRYPSVHGAPIHFGTPETIGITDLMKPDFGDPPPRTTSPLVPVFWACGVTPQSVIINAKPGICITHMPGSMLITDRLNADLAAF
ncbi:MAG TPA: putative hydro-lyase [Hyphomicrobiaceae bacterium]|nr:putative hydro-lyase [Hyphomicrobiaceae bacterium]